MKKLSCILVFIFGFQAAHAGSISGKARCRGIPDSSDIVLYAERESPETITPPPTPVILDQINLRFVPHVLPVVVGTTVVFPNSDELRHNVFSFSSAKRFNLGIYPKGASRQVTFDRPGEVALLCNIHLEMSAYVLVLQTPHFTVTHRDGGYNIKNVPAGKYTVKAWHESCKPASHPIEIKGQEDSAWDIELTPGR